MTSKSRSSSESRSLIPWRKRAVYKPSKSSRQRRKQYNQQMTMIYGLIGVTLVVGFIVILINWQNAGAAKSVSCEAYPEYCVPLAGNAGDSQYNSFEATDSRELDEESDAAAGVVRGMTEDNTPFIGNPDAPIHFRNVSNYACSHCNTFHTNDLTPFIEDYVMTGQATLEYNVVTTTAGGQYAEIAAQAAFCAGEQGAFWEMGDELYRLARAYGVGGFTMGQIEDSANNMDLDTDELVECVASGKYMPLIFAHQTFMQDNGVSGTPAVLYRYAGETEWTRLDNRTYDGMAQLTELANNATN